jgi:hypothetical protein
VGSLRDRAGFGVSEDVAHLIVVTRESGGCLQE